MIGGSGSRDVLSEDEHAVGIVDLRNLAETAEVFSVARGGPVSHLRIDVVDVRAGSHDGGECLLYLGDFGASTGDVTGYDAARGLDAGQCAAMHERRVRRRQIGHPATEGVEEQEDAR